MRASLTRPYMPIRFANNTKPKKHSQHTRLTWLPCLFFASFVSFSTFFLLLSLSPFPSLLLLAHIFHAASFVGIPYRQRLRLSKYGREHGHDNDLVYSLVRHRHMDIWKATTCARHVCAYRSRDRASG
ncbi:hypothetical protein BJV82DRAFT_609114 [Fennellomyces sp. T-0311]|nr:hypothetical protein BJV82DRAFT_609114 [Fennellomyces sp. T-0311]